MDFLTRMCESTGVTSVEDSPVAVQGTTLLGQRHSTSVSLATAARSPLQDNVILTFASVSARPATAVRRH